MQLIMRALCGVLLLCTLGRADVLWRENERIAGGDVAVPHSAPFTVIVRYGFARCGGVILDETTVVTAGHCSSAFYTVIAGDHNRFVDEGTEQQRSVVASYIHPFYENFDDAYAVYDLAILKIDQPFQFNEYVQPAQLPSGPTSFVGEAWAYGWGQTEKTTFLKQLRTFVLSDTECESELGSVPEDFQRSNMLCAKSDEGSTCFGDSGGPLMCEGDVLCGITSWVVAGCSGLYPQVFADVAQLLDFIQEPTFFNNQ